MTYTLAPTRTKQPAEVRKITFDFATKLNTGDAVATVVGNALEVAAGLTASAPSIVGATVTALVSGGLATNALGYKVSCRVTTTLGETLELDVYVRVADGVN